MPQELNNHILITGGAGVGKTTKIKALQKSLTLQGTKWVACAPTGVAALLSEGMTIHSLFGMYENEDKKLVVKLTANRMALLKESEVIFIDEISMIHCEMFGLMSHTLMKLMNSTQNFGGKKIVLSGDILQLPPIAPGYFFHSEHFNLNEFNVFYYDKVYRQDDPYFIGLLNNLRVGSNLKNNCFQDQCNTIDPNREYTKLFFSNNSVNDENENCLRLLKTPRRDFKALRESGNIKALSAFKERSRTPYELSIKEGARIMFTKNNLANGFANGSLGIVEKISSDIEGDFMMIRNLDTNLVIQVTRDSISNYDLINPASFYQFPITLGYAMTIHKSQGTTLENVYVDFEGLKFRQCESLVYTALSRVKTLKGLCVKNFNNSMAHVNAHALAFDETLRSKSLLHQLQI